MAKVRQDAWSHEDDLLLAETVLRHIREGSTQLNAFEEVGDKLNRTSAACGFRWNAEVRSKYERAIELAKRQRKEKKRAEARKQKLKAAANHSQPAGKMVEKTGGTSEISLDIVIDYLEKLKKDYHASNQSKKSLEKLEKENHVLREQNEQLEKELNETKKQLTTIQEDYRAFIQIMERARKMTVFEDDGNRKAPAFRMDKNGNLEQIAQDF